MRILFFQHSHAPQHSIVNVVGTHILINQSITNRISCDARGDVSTCRLKDETLFLFFIRRKTTLAPDMTKIFFSHRSALGSCYENWWFGRNYVDEQAFSLSLRSGLSIGPNCSLKKLRYLLEYIILITRQLNNFT